MSKLHLSFRNIRADVLDAATALIDAKPWREENANERVKLANNFVRSASLAYDIASPEVIIDTAYYAPLDYNPAEATMDDALHLPESVQAAQIVLRKFSLVNLFAGFRIHMLNSGIEPKENTSEPWGWAFSLFYTVRPVMFRARVREGRIDFVRPVDLFSQNTLARLTVAGLADEDGNPLSNGVTVALLERVESGEIDPETALAAAEGIDVDDLLDVEEDEDDEVEEHDPEAFAEEAERLEAEFGNSEGDHPELDEDNLDTLPLTELRKLSRGVFSGGYSMRKPDLIASLREHGIVRG